MSNAQKRFAWLFIVTALGMLASMAIAVTVSITYMRSTLNETIAREKAAGEAGRKASCFLIETIGDAYMEEPPSSPTGEAVVKAWRELAVAFGCKGD